MTMTKQKMFDTICIGAAKQKCRGTDSAGNCLYLTESGNKCFIGMLMTDKELETVEDSPYGIENLLSHHFFQNFKLYDASFLEDLQDVHDTNRVLNTLQDGMKDFCLKHNLNSEKVNLIKEWG